jgi:hypothetical protein
MPEETFLFEDFFVAPDDPGVEEIVEINGRQVPLMVKRGITLKDVEEAKTRAVKTHLSPSGQLVVDSIDEVVMTVEILLKAIKSWPFIKDGKPLPITRENLYAMRAEASAALQQLVKKLTSGRRESLGPFEKPSDEG